MSEPGVDVQAGRPGTLVRLGATIVGAASVLVGKALTALGIRRAPEGWRRTVGVLLRSESSRFALSAFGLQVPGGEATANESLERRVARGLQAFLAGEPDAHFALEWRKPVTLRRRIPSVDVVVLHFAEGGTLASLTPHLSAAVPPPPGADVQPRVHRAIVDAYNRTSRLPEVDRPFKLVEAVNAATAPAAFAGSPAAQTYARRLLAACCLSFDQRDSTDPAHRFCPPPFNSRRTLGWGYLSWVARTSSGRAVDLWVSAHHVGLDGVPLQDLLDRLERAWGIADTVTFPDAMDGRTFAGPHPCHAPGERPVDQLITFVDLSPVVTLRRALNAHHRDVLDGEVTVGALIAWLLSQEPEFAGVRIASTVDVAASGGYERDVDVVSLRPADFARGEAPWGGFAEYAREFNRLIAMARARTSPVRAGMQTAGLLPAWAHAAAVRANPSSLDETFGTLCVTIVRNARVFLAPMTDLGLGQGFFAIGSMTLPSSSGAPVTSVCVKGDAGRISHYPAILQRVIERARALHEAL